MGIYSKIGVEIKKLVTTFIFNDLNFTFGLRFLNIFLYNSKFFNVSTHVCLDRTSGEKYTSTK